MGDRLVVQINEPPLSLRSTNDYHRQTKKDTRPKQAYMGIRTIAPFKGMAKVVDRISRDLIHSGGISANRALIEWVRAQSMDFDCWDTEHGDNFSGRYESCLTDPKIEPRKPRWKIEVAIKLVDK
jgi:hypothetical protein